jgi:hypothetical protein
LLSLFLYLQKTCYMAFQTTYMISEISICFVCLPRKFFGSGFFASVLLWVVLSAISYNIRCSENGRYRQIRIIDTKGASTFECPCFPFQFLIKQLICGGWSQMVQNQLWTWYLACKGKLKYS